jgi:hypothetical protein
MSFFSNSNGVLIKGGTFYSASGDVNVFNDHQLAVQSTSANMLLDQGSASGDVNVCNDHQLAVQSTSANTLLDQGSIPDRHLSWNADLEARSLSGPMRHSGGGAESRRFLPYSV